MMTRLLPLLLLLILAAGPLAPDTHARARAGTFRRLTPRVKSYRPKTVSVRMHVTKRGRVVMPHRRAAPRRR